MPQANAYIAQLAGWIGRALSQSESLFANFTTEPLGVQLPDAVIASPAVTGALEHLKAAAQSIGSATAELEAAGPGTAEAELLGRFVKYGASLADYFKGLDDLVDHIESNITPATVPDPTARAKALDFTPTLAARLGSFVIASVITETATPLAVVLKLIGLLRWEIKPVDPADPLSRESVDMALELHRLKDLIHDPGGHLRQTLRWGENDFDPSSFFRIYARLFHPEESIRFAVIDGDPAIRHGSLIIRRQSALVPPGIELKFAALPPPIDLRTEITEEWGVGLKTSVALDAGAVATIRPPLTIDIAPEVGELSGELRLYADRNQAARPFDILPAGLINLAANDAQFGLGFKAAWNPADGNASIAPLVYAELTGGTLKLGSEGSDGFVSKLLAGAQIKGEFDLGLEWNAKDGLLIKASGGIEIALPIHRTLGPVDFNVLYIGLRIKNDGTLSLELSAGLAGHLGPLTAVVDRIGALLDLRFVENADADFGPFDLDLKFKPPNGVGLVVDAGMVKGGGYLFLDFDRGEYAGALELTFSGVIALKAIGIISTRMPDGSKGFSLLIIISVEFGTGIQLGFGFTLLAVGGLLGLNRTMNLQALMDGIRTDAVSSIMFPKDVVANAPKIISDLRAFFPPREGTFLVGPMAKLGWGTPTLVSISLGILIEIPGNIAIVGVLRIALPADDIALIKLQVNFAGAIEFDRKRTYFFAALFDSRVVFLTIEGEMGLLVAFGDDANFVVSVGGFHPRFIPPPLPFPSPRRIAVSLLNSSAARVRIEGYFGVTSNTAQFGARVEVFFGLDEINVQGHLAFDALFQFSPFYFIIEISASFSVKVFGVGLFSVGVRGSLEGPGPWHVKGHGSISLLFWDIGVDFETTWGESEDTQLPPITVMPMLQNELGKTETWRALLPPSSNLLVSLRGMSAGEAALILHPVGVLHVSQRALPLEIKLDKVGNQKPSDVNRLSIVVTGGGLAKKDDAFEQFAPAQFQDFSDADKLSKPAFAPERSGLDLSASGADLRSSVMVKRVVRYEEIIIDSNFKRFQRRFRDYFGVLFDFFLKGAAVTRCELSKAAKTKLQPFEEKIAVNDETYIVAFQADNKAVAPEAAAFRSEASAREYLQRMVDRDASLADAVHVIPSYEKAA